MKKILLYVLCVIYVLAGCGQMPAKQNVQSETEQAAVTAAVTPSPDVSSSVMHSAIALNYKPADLQKALEPVAALDSKTIIVNEEVDDVHVFIHGKKDDPENLYLSIEIGLELYEAAIIGYTTLKAEDFNISSVDVFSKTFIKITGARGANSPVSVYVDFTNPSPESLTIEAHTVEADVDEDGMKEIVGSVGTAAITTVYKLTESGYAEANVNEQLNAEVVLFDAEENIFKANTPENTWSEWKVD